jgi:2-dehydro-3-deoxyphosphogalactonate aldolase
MPDLFDPADALAAAIAQCPLVAILRSVRPAEVVEIADALVDAGFSMIEIPLNSPDPLASIALLAGRYAPAILVGAGTVLNLVDVQNVRASGGRLVVSPNVAPSVIRATVGEGMVSLPGYFTPTEAFEALDAGAHGLKLFPSEGASPSYLKAQRAVLPKAIPVFAVGGVSIDNLGRWLAAGADGAGLGSALYKPGLSAQEVGVRAADFVKCARQR